jgi:mono/diheme cytochrome c family protein
MNSVRSRTASLFAALVPVALALVSCSAQTETGGGAVAAADTAATAERGGYISMTSGCGDCHTPGTLFGAPDQSRLLSGSELGWSGPWGTTYARNLTPDSTTGIGTWSEDDIVNTLRTGKRPDGTDLRPPMPWQFFAVMHERDIRSLAKYLKSIPPVHHQNLPALPPGQKPTGSYMTFPAPSAWDVPPTK